MNKYLVEFIGAFALACIVGLSVAGNFVIITPILAALTLGLFVYTSGHVSGVHINPAITIGAWSIGKISTKQAAYYVAAQLLGGALAFVIVRMTYPGFGGVGGFNLAHFMGEMVGTFFFAYGVASAIYGKAPHDAIGLVVGGSLLLGISFAALIGSVGALNPAVAFALGTFNLVYIFAPIIGSVLGMQAYKVVAA